MTSAMSDDERAIRELVSTWLTASQRGDVDQVLSLMTDDVVFLVAGQPPMLRADFERLARAQAGEAGPHIEGTSDVEEIEVHGDVAFARTKLALTITPPGATTSIQRAGYTLTVFRRVSGRWLLARDANLLVRV